MNEKNETYQILFEKLKKIINFQSVIFLIKKDESLNIEYTNNFSSKINTTIILNSELINFLESIKEESQISKEKIEKYFPEIYNSSNNYYLMQIREKNLEGLIILVFSKKEKIKIDEDIILILKELFKKIIENKKLKTEIKKYSTQFSTLTEISKMIVSGNYLKEILHLIVVMTAEVLNSKIVSIMLLDEEKQELFIEATQSLSEEYIKKPPIKVGESISGKAVKEKKPITVLNVVEEPQYQYKEIAKKEGIVSMLAVPMLIKEKVLGVINCYTTTQHHFTDDEIRMLQSVANQAAAAIENTKLMEEIIATREALETRKIIERAKGILMKDLNIDEERAYKIINRQSMNTGKTMKEISEAIILSYEIKKINN
ncbi:MAG TPA: GAF and ANTAR domain-containing protein [bacterium]|nr:GAF and ANTAR domain-containing protein [bacterium]HOL48207.1 GAF and ANTAR domain-containing protein [bacterium]HPQ19193.1 GAF and ANTAR domain-containing protein [bacterium]